MIQMFNQDCMTAMKEMPDKAYDLAAAWDKMRLGWDKQRPGAEYFQELFRISVNQIVWGANYFTEHLPPSMGWIFWYKMQDNFSFSDGEFAFTSFNRKAKIFKYARGMESGFAPGGCAYPNSTPTQKPVRLYEWLLTNYAKPGDRILDTHGGSGSICIACDILGFDLDWYEIDAEYFRAAKERLERHQRQEVLPL